MGEEFRSRMMGLAERGGCESISLSLDTILLRRRKADRVASSALPFLSDIQEEQLKVLEDTSRKGAKADGLLSE